MHGVMQHDGRSGAAKHAAAAVPGYTVPQERCSGAYRLRRGCRAAALLTRLLMQWWRWDGLGDLAGKKDRGNGQG